MLDPDDAYLISVYEHYMMLWSINNIGCYTTMADYTAQQCDYGVLSPATELSRATMSEK